jgi:hypothetical protein
MRVAYGGRAAAYERKRDFERALRDHNMVVLLSGVEAEILAEVEAPSREAFLRDATDVMLKRSHCFRSLGRLDAAIKDIKKASQFHFEAQELAAKEAKPAKEAAKTDNPPKGEVQIINAWPAPVSIVVDGTAYRVDVAEQKSIPRAAGPVQYGSQENKKKQTVQVEAGKTVRIWIGIP